MMYRASQPNPIDLIGAMWIIEGLGQKMASGWAELVEKQVSTTTSCTKFMRYHGDNDEEHLNKLYQLLDRVCAHERDIDNIVRTASVVARLYLLQLEEIDHA
jgi:3-oxoacyl-[acyl-carrier-protein] synthase-3